MNNGSHFKCWLSYVCTVLQKSLLNLARYPACTRLYPHVIQLCISQWETESVLHSVGPQGTLVMVETNSRCSMIHRNLSQDIKKQQLCLKELKKLNILHAEHLKDDYLRYQR